MTDSRSSLGVRWFVSIALALALAAAAGSLPSWCRVSALHAAQTCPCAGSHPLGTCQVKAANYADLFPGSAVVVPEGELRHLYIADLYNGFTYRYNALSFEKTSPAPLKFPSPRGSKLTTGMAYVRVDDGEGITENLLVYAVDGELYRTGLGGEDPIRLGVVDLPQLAEYLREDAGDRGIQAGQLGGITFHETRGTLWGVDIVNDVYFEFDITGRLPLEGGKPRYFSNPKRPRTTAGAYGNSIAYVATAAGEFFDIPVGSLVDGRPSEVWRVYATDGAESGGRRIGDPTGVVYELGDALGSPPFVTGIAFWPDSCGEGEHSEILLALPAETVPGGAAPRIIQVSADDPDAAGLADFRCEALEDSVKLTWRKTLPYDSLSIVRRSLGKAVSEDTVFSTSDFANDPGAFADEGLAHGSYEYVATVVAAGRSLAPSRCRIAFGNGALVKTARFGPQGTADPVPYAVTVVGGDKVAVADFETGNVQLYDLDLEPLKTIPNPRPLGYVVGIAHASVAEGEETRDLLYWLWSTGNAHYLDVTDADGVPTGDPGFPAFVYPPDNLVAAGVALGDLDHDPVRNVFWTVDLLSQSVYPITAEGLVGEGFRSEQLKAPAPGGYLSGGIAVAASSAARVSLDIPAGEKSARFVDQIRRSEYDPSAPASDPAEVFRIDVAAAIGSAEIAGLDTVETQDGVFAYVAAMDTRAVYKLRITRGATQERLYRRGDANDDGKFDISDPSFVLEYLFRKGPEPHCLIAADADDSNAINITDAVYLFRYLFKGGEAPPAPFPGCGIDPDAVLPCARSICSD